METLFRNIDMAQNIVGKIPNIQEDTIWCEAWPRCTQWKYNCWWISATAPMFPCGWCQQALCIETRWLAGSLHPLNPLATGCCSLHHKQTSWLVLLPMPNPIWEQPCQVFRKASPNHRLYLDGNKIPIMQWKTRYIQGTCKGYRKWPSLCILLGSQT